MQVLGWLLFCAGASMMFVAGFVGVSGVANIPGVICGMALFVSGSIFASIAHATIEIKKSFGSSDSQTIPDAKPLVSDDGYF